MAASKNPRKPQVALRKGSSETGIIAELISLLETVTADGTTTESEAAELRAWLDENRHSDLPTRTSRRIVGRLETGQIPLWSRVGAD
jgi:hypothetical protein